MSKPELDLEALDRRLEERLRQGAPLKKKHKPLDPAPQLSAAVIMLKPYYGVYRPLNPNRIVKRGRWTAIPLSHTSAIPYVPTSDERAVELERAVGEAARRSRDERCSEIGWPDQSID